MSKCWIQTFSGRKFPLDKPDVNQIDIEDIAHALSMLCRFNGHCTKFYSVAEHSVHVSNEIDPELALVGLLHDAAEAYLGGVPSPLKGNLKKFKKLEKKMEKAIGKKFGIDPKLFTGAELKRADNQLLADEKAVLMAAEPEPWPLDTLEVKNTGRIVGWSPDEAKKQFLSRFVEPKGNLTRRAIFDLNQSRLL